MKPKPIFSIRVTPAANGCLIYLENNCKFSLPVSQSSNQTKSFITFRHEFLPPTRLGFIGRQITSLLLKSVVYSNSFLHREPLVNVSQALLHFKQQGSMCYISSFQCLCRIYLISLAQTVPPLCCFTLKKSPPGSFCWYSLSFYFC